MAELGALDEGGPQSSKAVVKRLGFGSKGDDRPEGF